MRRLIVLALVAAMVAATVVPAAAARRVTVAQLEETLAAAMVEHRPDGDVAHQIGSLELSERLTDITLGHLAAKLALQPRTALALKLLADQSAFLDPPASELPATGQPDQATQQGLTDAARGYALRTLPHMPDFFATRITNHFDDSAQVVEKGDWPVRAGLHPVVTATRQITFRDGKEIEDPVKEAAAEPGATKASQELGLHTWGEFGPELAVVLADTAKGTMTWSHWEQTSTGLAAVFHYSVPRAASHYAVNYCCVRDEQYAERRPMGYGGGRSQNGGQVNNLNKTVNAHPFNETPGYHGSISIDPATGAVLRVTLEAELKSGDPLLRAATVVEYGPVTIGDRSYICPTRSLAFSMEEAGGSAASAAGGKGAEALAWSAPAVRGAGAPTLLLNETSFTQYHRLGATMRVLTEAAGSGGQTAAGEALPGNSTNTDSAPPVPSPSAPGAGQTATQMAAASPAPVPSPGLAHAGAAEAAPAMDPAPPQPAPAPPAVPEISMSAATGVPDAPSNAPSSQDTGFSLKMTSRLVDVGLVAYDKKGHPVTDLKAEDFEIYDNGHKQEIRFFNQAAGQAPGQAAGATAQTASGAPARADAENRNFTNRAPDPAGGTSTIAATEGNATVLLIDESHIAWNDLNNARSQMLKFLGTLAPTERVGLYSMTGLGFRVLVEITTDHATLMARLKAFTPKAQSASQAQDEEMRNRQQFNEVHNTSDLNSVNGNHTDVPDADQPVDPQLLTMGSNPARASLIILTSVARHLSAIPGHKNVVWVSSDNVFADWQDQAVAIDKSPKFVESFALHAQEAMNDARAAVYPFDVSQLESAAITADIQHRNVELTQAAADNAATAAAGSGVANTATARNMTGGRISAEMSQDLHPIQGSIRQVAAATGGRTIRRSGDLAGELSEIVDDGHATYQLSFAPQGQADDQYHTITVKLSGRKGLNLRYRSGYLFAKEPATLKDRFQQAVWRPLDVSEIAVTAGVGPMSAGAAVKVNIAAGDLGLQQQAGRWMDKIDIFFIQRDDAGLHAHVEGQTLGLRLKSSTYQSLLPKGVPFEHAVSMRPGMASLRVLVVDENSGRMGSVTIPALAMETGH